MGDVVAVPDIRDGHAVKVRPLALADGEDVREPLARVRQIGEPIYHRNFAVPRELLDRLVGIDPQHHDVGHPSNDARDIGNALAATEAHFRRREVDAVPAELRRADVERKTRAQAGLLEAERDRPPGEIPPWASVVLEARSQAEERPELV